MALCPEFLGYSWSHLWPLRRHKHYFPHHLWDFSRIFFFLLSILPKSWGYGKLHTSEITTITAGGDPIWASAGRELYQTLQLSYWLVLKHWSFPKRKINPLIESSQQSNPSHYKEKVCFKGKFQATPKRQKLLERSQNTLSSASKNCFGLDYTRILSFPFHLPTFPPSIFFPFFTMRGKQKYTEGWCPGVRYPGDSQQKFYCFYL